MSRVSNYLSTAIYWTNVLLTLIRRHCNQQGRMSPPTAHPMQFDKYLGVWEDHHTTQRDTHKRVHVCAQDYENTQGTVRT